MGGGPGDDKQYGGPGNDTIYAGVGRDETWGEAGDDTLWALARKDVHGRNDIHGDTLHGGEGNDTFKTRDGEADVIDCGPGVDTALLDFKDVIADATAQNPNGSCEVVNRQPRRSENERGPRQEPSDSAGLTRPEAGVSDPMYIGLGTRSSSSSSCSDLRAREAAYG